MFGNKYLMPNLARNVCYQVTNFIPASQSTSSILSNCHQCCFLLRLSILCEIRGLIHVLMFIESCITAHGGLGFRHAALVCPAVRNLPLLWLWHRVCWCHRESWEPGGADLGALSSFPQRQFSKGLGHVNSTQEGANSASVQLLAHVWKRISSTVSISSCVFCAGNPFVSFQVKLYWYAVSLWQPFIRSETFDANFQEQNSHQFSVLGTLVNVVPNIVSCFRWSKRMQRSLLIIVVFMNPWPIQQFTVSCVQKHLQTSSLRGLTALLTTLQFFLKSVA